MQKKTGGIGHETIAGMRQAKQVADTTTGVGQ